MDALMRSMIGEGAEEQMHTYMGRRFAGCGGGRLPAGFGTMMGTMAAMMGGRGGSGLGPGNGLGAGSMMDPGGRGGGYGGYAPGSMMGGSRASNDDDDMPAGMWAAMLVLLAILLLIAAVAAWRWRPAQPPSRQSAAEILAQRYAAGDIDAQDYERRRRLIGGQA
jgi:uncharacterized membrane protein